MGDLGAGANRSGSGFGALVEVDDALLNMSAPVDFSVRERPGL
jgi:hypothetical protein